MSNAEVLHALEKLSTEAPEREKSFLDWVGRADIGLRKLTHGSQISPGFHITFERKTDVSVSVEKKRAPSGRHFLSLAAANMDRSGWYAVELDVNPEEIHDHSVVTLIIEAQCRDTVSTFAALRMFNPKGGWVDAASMEVDINADRSVRTYPISVSPAWRSKCAKSERCRLILFIEAKQSVINLFDCRVDMRRLGNSISDELQTGLEALLLDRLSPNHSRTVGVAPWTDGPSVDDLPLKSYDQIGPNLKIAFDKTTGEPKLTVKRVGETVKRRVDLSSIPNVDWLTLELDLGMAPQRIGAFALRAAASPPITLSPAIRVISAGSHVDYEIFDKIQLSSEAETYTQSVNLMKFIENTSSVDDYQLIFFLDGRPEAIEIDELIFSTE
jgi:hypothetical protein